MAGMLTSPPMQRTRPPLQSWDIFCRVIDNYGDAGVCWRLARQLVRIHGKSVRLWIDQPATLRALCPTLAADADRQQQKGITVCHWPAQFPATTAADIVIEAFACDLPPTYLQAMAARSTPPCWLNLEYLSAEPWIADCHGLASPHPSLPLTKYFFFPGFTARSGGLLREGTATAATAATADSTGQPPSLNLFCYANAPVAALLNALGNTSWQINVSPGQPRQALGSHFGGDGPWQHGHHHINALPFLAPDAYDTLLRQGTVNIVRGEDSFVRAQLAGRPFLWHIYPQADNAHLDKLNAFLDLYTADLTAELAHIVRAIFLAWNTPVTAAHLAACWHDFHAALPALAAHARCWQAHCQQLPELSAALVDFCQRLPSGHPGLTA